MPRRNNDAFWAKRSDYIEAGGSKGGGYAAAIAKTESMRGFA